MALEERSAIDKIEVTQEGCIQVRRKDEILRDGESVASTFHRHTLVPGADTSGEDPRVVSIAEVVWTDEVIAAYQASLPQETPAE